MYSGVSDQVIRCKKLEITARLLAHHKVVGLVRLCIGPEYMAQVCLTCMCEQIARPPRRHAWNTCPLYHAGALNNGSGDQLSPTNRALSARTSLQHMRLGRYSTPIATITQSMAPGMDLLPAVRARLGEAVGWSGNAVSITERADLFLRRGLLAS